MFFEIVAIIAGVALNVGMLWLLARYERRKLEKMQGIAIEGIQSAFEEEIRFPALDPGQILRIRSQVREVCVMRNIVAVAGSEAGENFHVTFTAFVIDVNGATHDLATSRDWAEVEEPAMRLASALGVPFTDSSYGTF